MERGRRKLFFCLFFPLMVSPSTMSEVSGRIMQARRPCLGGKYNVERPFINYTCPSAQLCSVRVNSMGKRG